METAEQISRLLHEAGETHHQVFRIVDGADDDWASWYAQWLIDLSELPDLLGTRPARSELIYLLVSLDKQYTAFGKLIKGDDVLEKIATTTTHAPDRPNKRMGVESVQIVPADSVK